VKALLAIICGLLLAGTPYLPAQTAPSAGQPPARTACHCGGRTCCCAQPTSPSPLAPSLPVSTVREIHFPAPVMVAEIATPAEAPATLTAGNSQRPNPTAGAPRFTLFCARLI